jgi:3-oxoadipate enol-lactonase
VAAHGFGGSVAETRPLLSGVPGTKVFPVARGHLDRPAATGYQDLADDLRAVADEHGATQALGVSMGAHALLRLLSQTPDRFTRVVLFLPATIDTPLVRRDDAFDDSEAGVRAELPADLEGVEAYVRARAAYLQASSGLAALRSALTPDVPVVSRAVLAAVTADVLLLAQEGDPVHPAQVARELASLLPRVRLQVFDRPGVAFRERARLRGLISGHLGAAPNG